jgi:hypothetical protein
VRVFVVLSIALFATVLAPVANAAHDPFEWDLAVAAMHDVDPSIQAPPNHPGVTRAVGGGTVGFGIRFGFGATLTPAGAEGGMKLAEAGPPPLITVASVRCLAAAALRGGGGKATIIGEIDPPQGIFQSLIFLVTDSGLPDGESDFITPQFSPLPPETAFPCTPKPGGILVTEGNIAVHAPAP